ncbi:MAG: transketolase family protein [Ruminococcaceae bacterium]|nr:transketolase family protein [Oscillospiraceae bacterium]
MIGEDNQMDTQILQPETSEMRQVLTNTLIKLAETDPRIVVLDADLMSAAGTKPFYAQYPDRGINCGVQEANMIGVAAGMSACGKVPFTHTFGTFSTRRACDQIFLSGAYARLNVKILGSDPGVTAALNGGTHMPFEDMGIMRGIPTMTVVEPTDSTMLVSLLPQIINNYGMYYIRLHRKNAIKIFADGTEFTIGKAAEIQDGKDVTIFSIGYCVAESLKAAQILAGKGISVRVVNMFTVKPIDREAVIKAAKETGAIVTAENHNVINGLGSAVAEVLAQECPTPLEMVGVKDEFGEVGPVEYLAERFGLVAKNIVEAAEKAIARK